TLRVVVAIALSAGAFSMGAGSAKADKFTLQDGRVLDGRLSRLNTMILNPALMQSGMPNLKLIDTIDDDLRRTYVPEKFVSRPEVDPAEQRLEGIDIDQPVATAGQRVASVGAILQVTPFDQF